MRSENVKEGLEKFSEVVSFNYPSMGWYFSREEINGAFIFRKHRWVCMFMYLKMMMNKGQPMRFSGDNGQACDGPSEYFGFSEMSDDGGRFLVETERVYRDEEIAAAYLSETRARIHNPKGRYLYIEPVKSMASGREVDVVNLFPAGHVDLLKLVTLSSYDRLSNDDTLTPNCSGCQCMFTIPYHEAFREKPRSVLGVFDIVVRNYLPEDMIVFSMPSERFVEMAKNIKGSFLDKKMG